MRRQGFILGLFSIGGQVLLLRELISSLHGDELFVGTALFGWLAAVVVGAYAGGRWHGRPYRRMAFLTGAVFLPVMILAVRLSPLLVSDTAGEIIPFSTAVLISIIAMLPIGLISGWLFPAITRNILYPASDAVVVVYLFEGIGAFIGGVIVTLAAGGGLSTLMLSLAIAIIVVFAEIAGANMRRAVLPLVGAATALIAAGFITPHVDRYVERSKYASYDVAAAFDTPYGHQTFLVRDSSLILVTDNSIEAVLPDRETAENQFLVPLIYHPGAQEILYIGRAEFGVTQLRGFLKAVQVTAVDPRSVLTSAIEKALPAGAGIRVIADDPVAYLSRRNVSATYDIIILNPGAPDSYRVSRLFTPEFLTAAKRWLKEDGVIFIPTSYDSDRYLAPEKRDVLAILYHTLQRSFARVNVWPGTSTLFLASDRRPLDLPYDSIMARIADFPDSAVYISEAYLADRLDSLKVDRLLAAVSATSLHQEMARPLLPHYQALWRSMRNTTDRKLVDFILNRPRWLYAIPLLVAAFFVAAVGRRRDSGAFALFLYFTAGLVSLSLELISFYVYQSMAGSLYSEMALLVGAFMLGLAVGVYYSHRSGDCPLEYPALAILITSVLIFWNTYRRVGPEALLPFHILFLFVVAVATGTLFVAATNRLYGRKLTANRGAGYAWELAGSSLGAFLTMTLLLPLIGLAGLMISLLALLFLALIGAAVSRKLTGS